MEDYFTEENEIVKRFFDLDEILSFQLEHSVEIIRGADYQYLCYIDKEGYGTSLTPMGALVWGIMQYKKHKLNNPTQKSSL